MNNLAVFSGNAHPQLAKDICRELGISLGKAQVFEFTNENIFVKIDENVRGCDVFVVQPLTTPVNRSIMELLIILDAFKRASAQRVTAVIPYYAYGRTDKKDQPRVPITARLIADCLSVAGAGRMLTLDLHAGQIQGFFNIPVDELTAKNLMANYIRERHIADLTVVATDAGFAKKARNLAELLDAPLAIVEKRRTGHEPDWLGRGAQCADRRRRDRHRWLAHTGGPGRAHAWSARGLRLRLAWHLERPCHRSPA
jgi:ribose-phosphate pyrophosphokinase